MKASIRLTLIIIGAIILLVMAVPVFLPGDVTVEATTEIKASPETVFNQVNMLRNWKEWSPFEDDSTMIDKYSGPDKGVGAKRKWTSRHLGNGNMAIAKSVPWRLIETKLDYGAPGAAEGRWTFSDKHGKTLVKWQLHILRLQYPFGKWLGLVMDKMMTPVLEKGLYNLKTKIEKQETGSHSKKRT